MPLKRVNLLSNKTFCFLKPVIPNRGAATHKGAAKCSIHCLFSVLLLGELQKVIFLPGKGAAQYFFVPGFRDPKKVENHCLMQLELPLAPWLSRIIWMVTKTICDLQF